ncbi:MAG TPA: HepT-like ribonuclease domain-containing protein, partial [Waddliaceae bacterium]
IKNSNQQIPWALIKGMRNRLIHEYFGTDLPVVWNVIRNDLPFLKSSLQLIYKSLVEEGK